MPTSQPPPPPPPRDAAGTIGWTVAPNYPPEKLDVPFLGTVSVDAGPPLADQQEVDGTWHGEALVRTGHLADGRKVVVKTRFEGRSPGRRDAAGWSRERAAYEQLNLNALLGERLDVPELLGELDGTDGRLHLVLSHIPGYSLSALAAEHESVGIDVVAGLGSWLTGIVTGCHTIGLALVETNPGSILVDLSGDHVRFGLLDFGQSRPLGEENIIPETNQLLPPHLQGIHVASEARDAALCAATIDWAVDHLAKDEMTSDLGRAIKDTAAVFLSSTDWELLNAAHSPVQVLHALLTHDPPLVPPAEDAARQALHLARDTDPRPAVRRQRRMITAAALAALVLATVVFGFTRSGAGTEQASPLAPTTLQKVPTDHTSLTATISPSMPDTSSPDTTAAPESTTSTTAAPIVSIVPTSPVTTSRPTTPIVVVAPPTTVPRGPCYDYPGNLVKPGQYQSSPSDVTQPWGTPSLFKVETGAAWQNDDNPYHITYDIYEIDTNCNRFRNGSYNAGPLAGSFFVGAGSIVQIVPTKDINQGPTNTKAGDTLEAQLITGSGDHAWIPPCC